MNIKITSQSLGIKLVARHTKLRGKKFSGFKE